MRIKLFKYIVPLLLIFFFSCKQENKPKDEFKAFETPLLLSVSHHLNKIDSIKNIAEMQNFVRSIKGMENFVIIDSTKFELRWCQNIYDSLNTLSWAIADVDNNGFSDLVTIGYANSQASLFCIMDSMGIKYKVNLVQKVYRNDCIKLIVNQIDKYPAIFLYRYNYQADSLEPIWNTKIFVYEFDRFLNYNPTPTNFTITKIELKTTACYGHCPIYHLEILKNGTVNCEDLKYESFNFKEGEAIKYKSSIRDNKFKILSNLLNYVDFTTIESNYDDAFHDAPLWTLNITYSDNYKKEIVYSPSFAPNGISAIFSELNTIYEATKEEYLVNKRHK